MPFCARCGAEADAAAAYCAACGARLRPPAEAEAEAEAPSPTTRISTTPLPPVGPRSDVRSAIPGWALSDWPLAIVASLGLVGTMVLAGAAWGLVLGLSANGFRPSGFVGAVAGLFLVFAGLGADTAVLAQAGGGALVWGSGALMPVVAVAFVLVARWFLRFGLRRIAEVPDRVAFAAKFALLGAVLLAILGGVAGVGDVDEGFSGDGFEVVSEIGSGEAAWWALFLLLGVGAWELRRARPLDRMFRWVPSGPARRPALLGGLAAVAVVAFLGVVLSIAGVAAGDSGRERLVGTFSAPLLLGNTGAAGHSVTLGSSVGIGRDFDDEVSDHLSFFNWGLPPAPDADGAPPWVLPLLLLVPAAAAFAAWRSLDEEPQVSSQAAIGRSLQVVAGYAAASWLLAMAAPLAVGGLAVSGPSGDLLFRGALAAPSVPATLGLSLLWALAGAAVATWLWARANGLDLLRALPPVVTPDPGATCEQCGAPMTGTDQFCPDCGRPVV